MPSFRIVVKDASGANSDLVREADSRGAVLRALRKEGFTPVSVESATKPALPSWLSFLEPGGRRPSGDFIGKHCAEDLTHDHGQPL